MKRLTMSRTPEDEATRDLYKLLYTEQENTKYEDVKQCIDRGAKLRDIEAFYGSPLIYAMRLGCDISIIKLIIDSGGADMNYKSGQIDEVFITDPNKMGVVLLGEDYIECLSIHNILLYKYCLATGSANITNQIVDELYKQGIIKTVVYDQDTPDYFHEYRYTYLKECCELLNIDIDTLKGAKLDFFPDITDTSTIPTDKQPYNWEYERDVYNIERGIEDSSDDE